jgi:hypothetical protein
MGQAGPFKLIALVVEDDAFQRELKRFPSDLNRWDSQRLMDERVFVH